MKAFFYTIIFLTVGMNSQSQTIDIELFANGFNRPVDITNAGDERLFIVERKGLIKIIDGDGNVMPQPFLDIDDLVFNSSNQDERGLLGMAFHPDYASNGFFFVNYTNNFSNTVISRFQVDSGNSNLADAGSEEIILTIEQPYANHNGGCIKFGPDGYLYIGMGDGGSGNDPQNYSQNRTSLLGKMLRIDVDNGLPYTIPEDNPFAEDDFTLDEIWAIGLRNPWRFSFDHETGDLWIGDVGQGFLEEIDFQPAGSSGGENYGWRCYEGTDFTNNSLMSDCQEAYIDPVFEVQHEGFGGPCSITGGFVYRGSRYNELEGVYVCADFCNGEFYTIVPNGIGGWSGNEVAQFPHNVSTFGEDNTGEIYFASFSTGEIYHLTGLNTVSVDNIAFLEAVTVSPNPTSGNTHLDLKSNGLLTLDLQLLDMSGKVMMFRSISINGAHKELIDMNEFASGSYILNITSGESLLSKQVIVYVY
jgi:glucose/arabinose dehydrogenase